MGTLLASLPPAPLGDLCWLSVKALNLFMPEGLVSAFTKKLLEREEDCVCLFVKRDNKFVQCPSKCIYYVLISRGKWSGLRKSNMGDTGLNSEPVLV